MHAVILFAMHFSLFSFYMHSSISFFIHTFLAFSLSLSLNRKISVSEGILNGFFIICDSSSSVHAVRHTTQLAESLCSENYELCSDQSHVSAIQLVQRILNRRQFITDLQIWDCSLWRQAFSE